MVMLFVFGVLLFLTALVLLSMATRSEAEATGINKSLAVLEAMSSAPSRNAASVTTSSGSEVAAAMNSVPTNDLCHP